MAAANDTDKRTDLLHRAVRYLETYGIADLSLSPLAAELGTSKRMLLYYFGSRENLIVEVLAASRPDVAGIFSDVIDESSLRRAALDLWTAITVGAQQRPIRILFQLLSLAATQPDRYEALAVDAVTVMVEPIAEVYQRLGVARASARARAGLLVSGLRGLCQDRIVTGDSDRIDAAAHLLVDSATSLR